MKARAIVEAIMDEKGVKKAQLGRAVGVPDEKNPSDVIGKRLKQDNISVNMLSEMLAAMGYTMVVVPAGTKVRDGEYELTITE